VGRGKVSPRLGGRGGLGWPRRREKLRWAHVWESNKIKNFKQKYRSKRRVKARVSGNMVTNLKFMGLTLGVCKRRDSGKGPILYCVGEKGGGRSGRILRTQ